MTITQELTLAPTLSVAENILMGRLPRGRMRRIDWARLRADAAAPSTASVFTSTRVTPSAS